MLKHVTSGGDRLRGWATQLRRNVAAEASRWQHCIRFHQPGNRPWTSRVDSNVFNYYTNHPQVRNTVLTTAKQEISN